MTMLFFRKIFLWAMLTFSAALLAGCAGEAARLCVDATCPSGEACLQDECQPLRLPNELGALGRFNQVALGPEGRLMVATYDATYRNLVLLREKENHSLEHVLIDGFRVESHAVIATDSGQYPALKVDDAGRAHLAWYDVDQGALRYALIADDKAWTRETVDGEGGQDRGTHTSMALGGDGSVHLAYRDRTSRRLRYAKRGPDGGWTHEGIGPCSNEADCPSLGDEDYGEYAALVLVAGSPKIVFYDRFRGDLKLASQSSTGTWSVTTLDGRDPETGLDTGDVGRFATVATDSKQRLAVAYFDATTQSLRYLFEGSSTAHSIVVDDGVVVDPTTFARRSHVVGQHVALAFDPQGHALLLYLDATALKIKRATLNGDQVVNLSEVPDLRAGGAISFAFDALGRVRGALGTWVANDAPTTELTHFELESALP